MRRSPVVLFWRALNPLMRRVAGYAPWWVLLETTGRRTGRVRRTPLAAGPTDAEGMWLIAVHGRRSGWLVNAEAHARVRLQHRGRWRSADAEVVAWDEQRVRSFSAYARSGPKLLGQDPLLLRLRYR